MKKFKILILSLLLLIIGCGTPQSQAPLQHVNLDFPRVIPYLGGKAIQDESGDVIPVEKVKLISTSSPVLEEDGIYTFIAVVQDDTESFWSGHGFNGFYVPYNYPEDRDKAYQRLMQELK